MVFFNKIKLCCSVEDSWNYVLIYLESFEGLLKSVKDEPEKHEPTEKESNGNTMYVKKNLLCN